MVTTFPSPARSHLRRSPVLPGRSDATAQTTTYEPTPGQAGKDVVWVPTPQELVEKMLDMAKVTPQDIVIDLGSGDGRNVIAAAKRGARAYGFEFNPEMVALSRRKCAGSGRRRSRDVHRGRHVRSRHFESHRAGALSAAEQPRQARAEVSGAAAGNAHGQQHVPGHRMGSRRLRDGRRQLHELVHVAPQHHPREAPQERGAWARTT